MILSSNQEGSNDVIRILKKEIIFLEGEASKYLYIIRHGKVRLVKEADNRLISLTVLKQKEFLGEIGIFDESIMNNTAIALEETELIKVEKKDIRNFLANSPQWVNKIMLTLSDRLKSANEIIKEHKIIDNRPELENNLSPEEEVELKEAISKHKKNAKTKSKA